MEIAELPDQDITPSTIIREPTLTNELPTVTECIATDPYLPRLMKDLGVTQEAYDALFEKIQADPVFQSHLTILEKMRPDVELHYPFHNPTNHFYPSLGYELLFSLTDPTLSDEDRIRAARAFVMHDLIQGDNAEIHTVESLLDEHFDSKMLNLQSDHGKKDTYDRYAKAGIIDDETSGFQITDSDEPDLQPILAVAGTLVKYSPDKDDYLAPSSLSSEDTFQLLKRIPGYKLSPDFTVDSREMQSILRYARHYSRADLYRIALMHRYSDTFDRAMADTAKVALEDSMTIFYDSEVDDIHDYVRFISSRVNQPSPEMFEKTLSEIQSQLGTTGFGKEITHMLTDLEKIAATIDISRFPGITKEQLVAGCKTRFIFYQASKSLHNALSLFHTVKPLDTQIDMKVSEANEAELRTLMRRYDVLTADFTPQDIYRSKRGK